MLDVIASMEEKGLEVRIANLGNRTLPVFGLKGGWFAQDNLILGWSGYGTLFTSSGELGGDGGFGYAGLYLDMRHGTYSPIHLSTSMFIGYGGADGLGIAGRKDFFLAEPSATAIFSITDYFKFGVGGSYRAYIAAPGIAGVDRSRVSVNFSLLFYNR